MYNLKDYEDGLKEKDSWIPDRDCKSKKGTGNWLRLGRDKKALRTTEKSKVSRLTSIFVIYFLISHSKDGKLIVRSLKS